MIQYSDEEIAYRIANAKNQRVRYYWSHWREERERYSKWRSDNIDSVRSSENDRKIKYYRNPEIRVKLLSRRKQWAVDNPEKLRNCYNNWRKDKFDSNPEYKLNYRIRKMLNDGLKRGHWAGSATKIYGAQLSVVKSHLSKSGSKYPDFNIDNYSGKEFNIDHIVPTGEFDLSSESEMLKAFHYTNLQVLRKDEHKTKHRRSVNNECIEAPTII